MKEKLSRLSQLSKVNANRQADGVRRFYAEAQRLPSELLATMINPSGKNAK
jgi:hypothetical protein